LSGSFGPHGRTFRIDIPDLPLAGGRVQITGALRSGVWSLEAHGTAVDLARLVRIARPWVSLPPGYGISGHADFTIALTGRSAQRLRFQAHSTDLNLTNQPGTIVAQQ